MEMTARFSGTCAKTGRRIRPGDRIDYDRKARTATLIAQHNRSEPVSEEIRIGDLTFYRNRKGRCEDAPCCGCCTI